MALRLTLSLNSRPGLKCTIYLPAVTKFSPVFGFLAVLGARYRRLKIPNPRISALPPLLKQLIIFLKILRIILSTRWFGKSCFSVISLTISVNLTRPRLLCYNIHVLDCSILRLWICAKVRELGRC